MSINSRIKQIRISKKLSQQQFGEQIGLKQGAVSRMEQEGMVVIDQNIRLICQVFHIREEWLRHGTGDRMASTEESLLLPLADRYQMTDCQLQYMKSYLALPSSEREIIAQSARVWQKDGAGKAGKSCG